MNTDLLRYRKEFDDAISLNTFPSIPEPYYGCNQIAFPAKNQFDVDIFRSHDNTMIRLAEIAERVNKENNLHEEAMNREYTKNSTIHKGIDDHMKHIEGTPGAKRRNLVIRGEEKGFFRRRPTLFSIEMEDEF